MKLCESGILSRTNVTRLRFPDPCSLIPVSCLILPQMRKTLSVAMIAMNEEANLPRTLESVKWADEIIVVDSGSKDRTL